ncbi:hypothetical protein DQ04_04531080 [Trypanosoma grayi]|uniref:hypothetical protein n=1 Tax=Trypanosoma grayi TaxID=71804 RepID=UPI0004F41697|nr:hypothetical protein DQ04_04531080 [Trypanosoma grayi]KEG09858.1 hypothetical protein DQ04_04531080 [Trypanosoma grayi]
MLWAMEWMKERQELVLVEQSERKAVEFDEVGHRVDVQLLQSLQLAQLSAQVGDAAVGSLKGDSASRVRRRGAGVDSYAMSSLSSPSRGSTGATQVEYETGSTPSTVSSISYIEDRALSMNSGGDGLEPAEEEETTSRAASVGAARAIRALEGDEEAKRNALCAAWRRGIDNMIELDGISAEGLRRATALSSTMVVRAHRVAC